METTEHTEYTEERKGNCSRFPFFLGDLGGRSFPSPFPRFASGLARQFHRGSQDGSVGGAVILSEAEGSLWSFRLDPIARTEPRSYNIPYIVASCRRSPTPFGRSFARGGNLKAQASNFKQYRNEENKIKFENSRDLLRFPVWILKFVCDLGFVIWNLPSVLQSNFSVFSVFRGSTLPFRVFSVFRGKILSFFRFSPLNPEPRTLTPLPAFGVILLSLCLFSSSASAAISDDFSRYQEIINRKPFGEPPPEAAAPAAAPAAPADLFTKTLKMVAIKLDKKGKIKVGFINQAAANKSYYLTLGETSADGIELVDADFALQSAMLKKDGQSGWIYMNGSTSVIGSSSANVAKRLSIPDSTQNRRSSMGLGSSPLSRKVQEIREKQIAAQMADKPTMTTVEINKQLEDYQMEVLRKGLPALPVPLTQAMDDQLVSEGILPAR